jgi:hypothetical protein
MRLGGHLSQVTRDKISATKQAAFRRAIKQRLATVTKEKKPRNGKDGNQ